MRSWSARVRATCARTSRRRAGAVRVHNPDWRIVFYQTAPGQLLGFFLADKFNEDLALPGDHSRVSGVIFAHNVDSPDEVTVLADAMSAAGGALRKAPQPGQFGGVFHAHVQDPNGLIWEVAHNPDWRIEPDGTVRLGSAS